MGSLYTPTETSVIGKGATDLSSPGNDFILIDLASQADAVAHIVAGWSAADIQTWLHQQGTLELVRHPTDSSLYRFCSAVGIVTSVRITGDGKVFIVSNHTIRQLTPE